MVLTSFPGFTGLFCEVALVDSTEVPPVTSADAVTGLVTSAEIASTTGSECLSDPCQNGAICRVGEGFYTCLCTEGMCEPLQNTGNTYMALHKVGSIYT